MTTTGRKRGDTVLEMIDLARLPDEETRVVVRQLVNHIEVLHGDLTKAREEIVRLCAENARLKGEQGPPTIRPQAGGAKAGEDVSSEGERRVPRLRRRGGKGSRLQQVRVDREEKVFLDRSGLPGDVQDKGFVEEVVQEVVLCTDTVRFLKQKWYSKATGKTYVAPLAPGYTGQFGPRIKALTLALYFQGQMSEGKLLELYRSIGVVISAGQLSTMLLHGHPSLHAEHEAIARASVQGSVWKHTDVTATRVNGENYSCHLLCDPFCTVYRTYPGKDRLTVLDVLRQGTPRRYRLNDEAEALLTRVALAKWVRQAVSRFPRDQDVDEATLLGWLDGVTPTLGTQQRTWIMHALGVAAYHAQTDAPVVRALVRDDAPEYDWLTHETALCWIHDARHYKRLGPFFPQHHQLLRQFQNTYWDFYRELLAYRCHPTPADAARLAARFDDIFSTVTGYDALDDRIAKTHAKRAGLLLVLAHPEIPLHNNSAELGARLRVRKRDVSFGPRSPAGVRAWDTFHTLAATATKLGVSLYHYLADRLSCANRLPSLASLVSARHHQANLSASWSLP